MMRRFRVISFLFTVAATVAVVWAGVHEEVVRLSQKAREGDAESLYILATLHDRGFDTIPVDSVRSTELYRLAAEKGNLEAMNYLGYRLLTGEVAEIGVDVEEGLEWLETAAYSGDPKAASNLGWLLTEGEYVRKDYSKAAFWLNRAAEKGLAVAQSMLGDLYHYGQGVRADSVVADSLFREAFDRGLTDAAYKLEDLNGVKYSTFTPEELVAEGRYFYLRSAPSVGVKLFYKAAEAGDSDALALLGDAYTRAIGVPYNHDLSLRYYARAALAGNHSAQFVIGELLEIFPDALDALEEEVGPEGMPDDPAYWFEKAAEGGVTDADIATRLLLEGK